MGRFVTGDLHFFHQNIIRYCTRPFAGVAEMNEALERHWNDLIQDGDEVYVLGDFALARPERYFELGKLFGRLRGKKYLLKGNHDRGAVLDLPWERLIVAGTLEVDGVVLVHDGYDLENPKTYADRPIFQAHVHDVWKQRANRLNCGVDVWHFRPVEWGQAKAYWASRFDYFKRTGRDA